MSSTILLSDKFIKHLFKTLLAHFDVDIADNNPYFINYLNTLKLAKLIFENKFLSFQGKVRQDYKGKKGKRKEKERRLLPS